MDAWDLLVDRTDLTRTQLVEVPVPLMSDGEVLLKVSRVGVTANNVTYAVFGEGMHYWDFFPAEPGWGRVPVWGFADVAESGVASLPVGTRVYGYLPMSSHLVVRPEGPPARFRDATEHRAALPPVYNAYNVTAEDPAYAEDTEGLQVLYRPLFGTSFFLDDYVADAGFFGAEAVVLSSASSKTAYCTAHLVHSRPDAPEVVGVTSAANVAFTESLGCYDRVLTYDDVATLPARPTAYVDMSGSAALRSALHHHLGDELRADVVVGFTHHDEQPGSGEQLPGARPAFFFAPDQIKKRSEEWGPDVMQERFGGAWQRFVPVGAQWVDVVEHTGPDALAAVWQDVLTGAAEPRQGHVIAF